MREFSWIYFLLCSVYQSIRQSTCLNPIRFCCGRFNYVELEVRMRWGRFEKKFVMWWYIYFFKKFKFEDVLKFFFSFNLILNGENRTQTFTLFFINFYKFHIFKVGKYLMTIWEKWIVNVFLMYYKSKLLNFTQKLNFLKLTFLGVIHWFMDVIPWFRGEGVCDFVRL